MKARPILFSTPMVEALLDGRKTQTRRMLRYQDEFFNDWEFSHLYDAPANLLQVAMTRNNKTYSFACPYGKVGDLLWVRETFMIAKNSKEAGLRNPCLYRADGESVQTWKPSIFMPREASRLTLEITNIRVERLNKLSEEDAIAEGVIPVGDFREKIVGYKASKNMGWWVLAKDAYRDLWQNINGTSSWDLNPWVWVIEFKVHNENVDKILTNEEK